MRCAKKWGIGLIFFSFLRPMSCIHIFRPHARVVYAPCTGSRNFSTIRAGAPIVVRRNIGFKLSYDVNVARHGSEHGHAAAGYCHLWRFIFPVYSTVYDTYVSPAYGPTLSRRHTGHRGMRYK